MNGLFSVIVAATFFLHSELSDSTVERLRGKKAQRKITSDGSHTIRKGHQLHHHAGTVRRLTRRRHAIVHNPNNAIHEQGDTHKTHVVKTRKRVHMQKNRALAKHAALSDAKFRARARGTHRSKGKDVSHSEGSRKQAAMEGIHKLHEEKRGKYKPKGNEEADVDKTEEIKEDLTMQKPSAQKQEKQQGEKDNLQPLESRHGGKSRKHTRTSQKLHEETLKLLRKALLVHPFKTWKFKDRFRSMSDLGIHEVQLHDIIANKWNKRLKHKLHKVLNGKNIHLAIIGGSNSAGGGIQEDEGGTEGIFFRVISDWWRKTITPVTGSRLKMRQIAMGGTGSDFFQYCYKAYIQENVDIVLLEMSVNDLKQLPPSVNLSLPIEQLTRQLLKFPTQPAVIYVNLLSGRTYHQGCVNLEDFGQHLLSDVYDITTFSWRDAVCPMIDGEFRSPLTSCGVVCKDGHHINQLGHAHISLMFINLLRDQILDSLARELGKGSREVFDDYMHLPEPVFITSHNKIITSPICWTTISPNYKNFTIQNNIDVGVMENYGFDYLHDAKIGGKCHMGRSCRGDAYSGWTGEDVGAYLTLSFTVPALEHKRGLRSRSVVFATRTCSHCGAAAIWLDDDYDKRRFVNAKSSFFQTSMEIIALRVNPGDHTMSVRVVGEGKVTIVGVMLGPPDGPY